jgi:hypothetical protein
MTLCSLAGGLLLFAWAQVHTPWAFYLIWVLIGASMAGVLYEPAFALLTAVFGPDARRAITALTLGLQALSSDNATCAIIRR